MDLNTTNQTMSKKDITIANRVMVSRAILNYITKQVIAGAKLTSAVSHNRMNNVITNNIDQTITMSGFTAFSPNTDLGLVVEHYTNRVVNENVSDEKFIDAMIREDYSRIGTTTINSIIKAFITRLDKSFDTLKTIHTHADYLLKNFQTKYEALCAAEKNKSLVTAVTYETEDWSYIDSIGPEDDIIIEINVDENDTETSMKHMANYANKVSLMLELKHDFKPVELTTDKQKRIVNELFLKTGLDRRYGQSYLRMVTSETAIRDEVSRLTMYQNIGLGKDHFNFVQMDLKYIDKFLKGFKSVCAQEKNLDLSVTGPIVDRNVRVLMACQKGYVYLLSHYRYNLFKNFAILPNKKVNKDVLSQMTQAGITKDDILMVNTYFNELFPSGITIEAMTDCVKTGNLKKRMEHDIAFQKKYAVTNEKVNMESAFASVVMDKMKSLNKYYSENYITQMAREVASNKREPSYGFYQILFKMFNTDDLTINLFDQLSEAYMKVESLEDAFNKDTDTQKVKVLIDLVTGFMVKKFQ